MLSRSSTAKLHEFLCIGNPQVWTGIANTSASRGESLVAETAKQYEGNEEVRFEQLREELLNGASWAAMNKYDLQATVKEANWLKDHDCDKFVHFTIDGNIWRFALAAQDAALYQELGTYQSEIKFPTKFAMTTRASQLEKRRVALQNFLCSVLAKLNGLQLPTRARLALLKHLDAIDK